MVAPSAAPLPATPPIGVAAPSGRPAGPPPQSDHYRRRGSENLRRDLFLDAADLGLSSDEQLTDWTVSLLDLTIQVDKRPAADARDLLADRRLSRAHEADEREMTVERA